MLFFLVKVNEYLTLNVSVSCVTCVRNTFMLSVMGGTRVIGVLVHVLLVRRERVMHEGSTNEVFLELQRTHL